MSAGIRVVLVEPEGSVNVGFIARICMNFGADELYMVKPHIDMEEAARYAANADSFLRNARIVETLKEAINGVELVVATSGKGSSAGDPLRQAVPSRYFAEEIAPAYRSIAIMFGRESTGLKRSEIAMADLLVTIPASPRYPILNLSHAVAVILYDLWLTRGVASNIPPAADKEILGEIEGLIDNVLAELGIHRDKVERACRVLRSLLYRARPSAYEAGMVRYILYRVLRRLRECG